MPVHLSAKEIIDLQHKQLILSSFRVAVYFFRSGLNGIYPFSFIHQIAIDLPALIFHFRCTGLGNDLLYSQDTGQPRRCHIAPGQIPALIDTGPGGYLLRVPCPEELDIEIPEALLLIRRYFPHKFSQRYLLLLYLGKGLFPGTHRIEDRFQCSKSDILRLFRSHRLLKACQCLPTQCLRLSGDLVGDLRIPALKDILLFLKKPGLPVLFYLHHRGGMVADHGHALRIRIDIDLIRALVPEHPGPAVGYALLRQVAPDHSVPIGL